MEKNRFNEYAVYQIYPMSFCDSNQDGKGDLQGIISKLDYLQSIGIHTIWLSPIYESPMVDMGYDISDYYRINPIYGTMEDFDRLMEETKKRDIRVIMDLVVNHTSDQCRWFKEAIEDPESIYRDYYIFRKGRGKDNRMPPNNWTSSFLGSAWQELENEKGTFYLHLFSKEQPDLNFHNEAVIREVEKIMEFWLNKGVYGFRSDVISCIYKESYEDGKKQGFATATPVGVEHYIATEGCHEILKRLRREVIEPHHAVFIGETFGVDLESGPRFLEHELDAFFSFEHVNINANRWSKEYIDPIKFKKVLLDWQTRIDWNGVYLENHDQHRSIGKYIRKGYENIGAKMLLTLVYTLRGTPFIYQGQEIGMVNYPNLPIEECNDLVTHFIYDMAHKDYHLPGRLALKKARHNGRDDPRAPMAFTSQKGFGFSSPDVKPWQVYHPFNDRINVETEMKDEDSVLNYFRRITALRKDSEALCIGSFTPLDHVPEKVLGFIRETDSEKLLVLLNLDKKTEDIQNLMSQYHLDNPLIGNYKNYRNTGKLLPYQALVFRI